MNEILIFPNRSELLFRHNLRVDEIDGDGLRISGRDHLRFSAVVAEVDLIRNKQHSKTGRLHPGEHSLLTYANINILFNVMLQPGVHYI
jgi:hypothetical protein